MSVADTLRSRFAEVADDEGVDISDVELAESSRGYLRVDGPGIEATEIWGNSGVRDVVNRLGGDASTSDDPAARDAEAGRAADRREALEELASLPVRFSGEGPTGEELAELAEVGLESDRVFIGGGGGEKNLTLFETAEGRDAQFTIQTDPTDTTNPIARISDALETLPASTIRSVGAGAFQTTDEELVERAAERDVRRETREAGREAAEAAGVDLDEFAIGGTAEGEVIVQDRDTGRTRTIDADAPGGVGSAIDAATGDGQFVADSADPAAGTSGSGDGLGARAAGAIVLLFGALAAALGWLS